MPRTKDIAAKAKMKTYTLRSLTLKFYAMLIALPCLISCGTKAPAPVATESPKAPAASTPAYPVKVSANGRYLVDQNNTPFLIVGDSPQGLMARLSEKEADAFFADRQAHGFNTMGWIDVACAGHDFRTNVNATTPDGIRPFAGFLPGGTDYAHYDLGKPNEAYFTRLDDMIKLAAKHGILVFIDPIETIGWLPTLRNNGLSADYAYGQYLGSRYKHFPNVAWLNGNDFAPWRTPGDDALVLAVAKGIKSTDPGHIQTVELLLRAHHTPHWRTRSELYTSSAFDDPVWIPLTAINGAYTDGPTYIQMLHSYNQKPVAPAYLVEAHYELERVGNPSDYGTPSVLRREEYWTMLSGGKGQFYGNFYTWSFQDGWQSNIDTVGVKQLEIWKHLFTSLPWQDLVPDQDHSIVTAGLGDYGDVQTPVSKSDFSTASRTPDGSFVVAYMPTARTITVNMASLRGASNAKWFDPTNGSYTIISGQPFANVGTRQFTPPAKNHDGDSDWVLLLEASS
jgi:Protein of unknown function (DUF4038)/Putative collagen-binding domain of a collagenase